MKEKEEVSGKERRREEDREEGVKRRRRKVKERICRSERLFHPDKVKKNN